MTNAEPQPEGQEARLGKGDYIMQAAAVEHYGKAVMDAIMKRKRERENGGS